MTNTLCIWSINTFIIASILLVFHSSSSVDANVKVSAHPTHLRSNSISNASSNTNNRSPSNGGIYFSDIPLSDAEGSADGPDDDLDDNASGKGEDDEDTKDIIDKEGSGSEPNGSPPDSDDEDDDLELGSGGDQLFISSTERPTKKPEVTKTPVTAPHEPKVFDIEEEPKRTDPFPEVDENRVPTELRPAVETSTRFTVPSSTHWSHDRDREDDDNSLGNDVSIMGQKQVTPASFFARPGILAAVIGGAVVGLLCAILLVMFIVYRMRKKDEGSYALDEHKRTTSANPYTRGASKELYA